MAQEGEERESEGLGGELGFGFLAGPGKEHGRRRRRCPLRERLRDKGKIIFCCKRTCSIRHVLLSIFGCVADSGFVSFLGWVFRPVLWGNVLCG